MTRAPSLPGTLRDLLAPGLVVYQHDDALHCEFDPDQWRTPGGTIVTISDGWVGTATPNRHAVGGVQQDRFPADTIHDCGQDTCPWRPQTGRAADTRWIARRLLRLVGQGHGRLTDADRRHIHTAVALLTGML